jgi:hypothetical protein
MGLNSHQRLLFNVLDKNCVTISLSLGTDTLQKVYNELIPHFCFSRGGISILAGHLEPSHSPLGDDPGMFLPIF